MNIMIITVIIILIIVVIVWYTQIYNKSPEEEDPYKAMISLSRDIHHMRNEQNKEYHMSNAKDSKIKSIATLHDKISTNHDQILSEVKALMDSGYTGYPMAHIDKEQAYLTQGKTLWSPIWIKFIDTWAGTADSIPTLKKIVSESEDVLLLHVSVFKPGTVLPMHVGISMGVWRYHYGLKIPEGNLGLNVNGQMVKWEEREGFIWDDTLPHEAWNLTDDTRLVIFADVYRETDNTLITKKRLVKSHIDLQKMDHVKSIASRLQLEGKMKSN